MNSNFDLGIFIFDPAEIPNSLDTFKQTIHAIHAKVQSPIGIALASALSTAAACTQHLADVMCPGGGLSPISLYVLVSANSGERKTSTDRQFMRCISDFEKTRRNTSNQSSASQAAAQDIWKGRLSVLKKALNKAISENDKKSLSILEEDLKNHYASFPSIPTEFRMLFEDATMPALLRELANSCNSAYLSSSEGGILLGRTGGDYLFYMNKLWDGEDLRVDRVKERSFTVSNVRLSLSAMMQDKTLLHFARRKDGFAKSSGFLARCLTIAPQSTQGYRFNSFSEHQTSENKDYIDWFYGRASTLLNQISGGKDSSRHVISFSPEAAKIWQHFYVQVESELRDRGTLADIREFASKISNNMSRIAAVLHLFCGLKGDISAETAIFSADLCKTFISEFKKIFGHKDPVAQAYKNAHELHKFLYERSNGIPYQEVPKRWLCQYGPCRLSIDFDVAVKILCDKGILNITHGPKGSYSVSLKPGAINILQASPPHSIPHATDNWGMLLQSSKSSGSVI